jgi:hypothetical protein
MSLGFEKLIRQKKLYRFAENGERWFRFFMDNIDTIALADFAKASRDDIDQIKSMIPKHSYLHIRLKRAYDRKYYKEWGRYTRGAYYPFLMRVCSGFRNVFNDCNCK